MDKNDLWNLRKEIVLNSLFLKDYSNSYGIDEKIVCSFFDSYLDDLCDIYKEKHKTKKYDITDVIDELDNSDNLFIYYSLYEDDPLYEKE